MYADLKNLLIIDFEDYVVNLNKFFVTTIVKPDGDKQYEKFKDLHFRQYADIAEAKLNQQVQIIAEETDSQKIVIRSQAIAKKREQEGYTYQQERGYDVAEQVAQNESVGQFTNMGIGLGTMVGIGGPVSGVVGGAINDALNVNAPNQNTNENNELEFCENCGEKVSKDAAFCENCGAAQGKPKVCSKCGYKFIKDGNYCPKCGTKRSE